MPRKTKSLLSLPQTEDQWYCAVRLLRTWLEPKEGGETFIRPLCLFVVDLKSGLILATVLLEEPIPPKELNQKLLNIMRKPEKLLSVAAHRPAEVHFEDEGLAEAMQPLLAEVEVKARYSPQRENMDALVRELEKGMLSEEDRIPGLLAQRGVTPEMVGSLFQAARAFYQAAPWVQLSNFDLLAVRVKPQKKPYFVIVMGQAGEEYGLAIYRNWQEIESFFNAINPLEAIPQQGRLSFTFNEPPDISFDDLDAIATYGWELPAPDLVPTPMIYLIDRVKRPDAKMLRWIEAALRAIPRFVSEHLQTNPDETHPAVEATIEVQTSAGATQVFIRYPGGDLSALGNGIASRWVDLMEEDEPEVGLPAFDRRGMEGLMAQLAAGMEETSSVKDTALHKAQQIMYQAWEERSPARRIALAKQALKTSANCADAYVLLAEEEAQTAREALERYQAGVEAGRRALGADFLADPENVGYFWGILETRPFMRALVGLANTQWELGQREEALRTYRELLRLNPNDNQGIRYLLLNLLLEMGQEEAARSLLKDYEGDWSADWTYTAVLLSFRQNGPGAKTEAALRQALEVNQHVPDFLVGKKRIRANRSGMITLGGEDEAKQYASAHLNYWRKTPGAVDWLREQTSSGKKRK